MVNTLSYYQRNKEKLLTAKKAYYQENKEKLLTAKKAHYQENRDKALAYKKAYYHANKEKRKEYRRKFREDNYEHVKKQEDSYRVKEYRADPVAYMWRNKKASAKHKGIEFDITEKDIADIMTEQCPVLGIDLRFNFGKGAGHNNDDSYSIDRIDSSKGYVKGNIQMISKRANTIKSDATLEELEKLVAYMRKQQGDKE